MNSAKTLLELGLSASVALYESKQDEPIYEEVAKLFESIEQVGKFNPTERSHLFAASTFLIAFRIPGNFDDILKTSKRLLRSIHQNSDISYLTKEKLFRVLYSLACEKGRRKLEAFAEDSYKIF